MRVLHSRRGSKTGSHKHRGRQKQSGALMYLARFWDFIWEDDSIWSWLANIALAFVLIKFIIYPVLGFFFGTHLPIVAVVSGSMEHGFTPLPNGQYQICGQQYDSLDGAPEDLAGYWEYCGAWYERRNITLEQFEQFPFKNGFNKGDIMILFGTTAPQVAMGDVIVFQSSRPYPIIHRVVYTWQEGDKIYLQTKGDHNVDTIKNQVLNEYGITEEKILGVAKLRIPYLGYIKIWAVELLSMITGQQKPIILDGLGGTY